MERIHGSSSSKGSLSPWEDMSGGCDTGLLIPIQLSTLNMLASFFKEDWKSTNNEQFLEVLKKDPVLNGFMDNYFKEHDAIMRGSLDKFTMNWRVKNLPQEENIAKETTVGEKAIIPDDSGNIDKTNVDETSIDVHPNLGGAKATAESIVSVHMHVELDEAEVTDVGTDAMIPVGNENEDETDVDETDDDKTDVDDTHDDETDEDETDVDETDEDETDIDETDDDASVLSPVTRSHIEKLTQDPFIVPVAERIANDKKLIGIADKILEPLQNAEHGITSSVKAQQHSEAVVLFWKNEHFQKGLYDELLENPMLSHELLAYSINSITEPPEDRMVRIKADPSLIKVLEADNPVVKMTGVLSILIGYWVNKDVLTELAKAMDGPDIDSFIKFHLKIWMRRNY